MAEAASTATVCCRTLDTLCNGFIPSARISVAVMRHGERLDAADPTGWFQSAAGKQYPFDCPLSPKGRTQVANVAHELVQKSSSSFSCVVSSPFLRCVETSVEVCRALGLPICIDMQLGEVFGPACFGEWSAPGPVRRNQEEVMALVPPDIRAVAPVDFIGEEPTWPESIEDARLRMVTRVEQYAEWAARLEGANFVLVTHGDCVGACLTLALAGEGGSVSQVVDKVDYCGWALLERVWEPGEPTSMGLLDEDAKWHVQHGHVTMRDVYCPYESSIACPAAMVSYTEEDDLDALVLRTTPRRSESRQPPAKAGDRSPPEVDDPLGGPSPRGIPGVVCI